MRYRSFLERPPVPASTDRASAETRGSRFVASRSLAFGVVSTPGPIYAMGVSSDAGPAPKPPGSARVILTVFLYLGLNSSLNLLNRYTLGMAGFKFPVSLTCMHLAFQICALAPIVLLRSREGKETHRAVVKRLWRGLFAIGTFMAVNISLNNASLLHLSLSYNQVIRASIPVVCAACAVLVEKKIPTALEALGLALVAAGVMGTVAGSTSQLEQRPNEVTGLIFCVVATVSNALMMTFSGKIMGGEKLDAVSLTFYTSPVVLVLLLPVALGLEWEKMTKRLRYEGLEDDPFSAAVVETPGFVSGSGLLRLVFLGCCNAVVYNWVHNKVIAMTSATTTTVLGNVKVAMLFLFSRVLFGETKDWTWAMACGAGVALGGFAVFSFAKLQAAKRATQTQGA